MGAQGLGAVAEAAPRAQSEAEGSAFLLSSCTPPPATRANTHRQAAFQTPEYRRNMDWGGLRGTRISPPLLLESAQLQDGIRAGPTEAPATTPHHPQDACPQPEVDLGGGQISKTCKLVHSTQGSKHKKGEAQGDLVSPSSTPRTLQEGFLPAVEQPAISG